MIKQKKSALAGNQLVLLIIGLVVLGFLIYWIYLAKGQSVEIIAQIKDFLFS